MFPFFSWARVFFGEDEKGLWVAVEEGVVIHAAAHLAAGEGRANGVN